MLGVRETLTYSALPCPQRTGILQQPDIYTFPWSFLFTKHHLFFHSEQSISSARASVMVYDDGLKRWVPSGSSSGLSKVHIYHHTQHNTFRVVGRKLNDHEVDGNISQNIFRTSTACYGCRNELTRYRGPGTQRATEGSGWVISQ